MKEADTPVKDRDTPMEGPRQAHEGPLHAHEIDHNSRLHVTAVRAHALAAQPE